MLNLTCKNIKKYLTPWNHVPEHELSEELILWLVGKVWGLSWLFGLGACGQKRAPEGCEPKVGGAFPLPQGCYYDP